MEGLKIDPPAPATPFPFIILLVEGFGTQKFTEVKAHTSATYPVLFANAQ